MVLDEDSYVSTKGVFTGDCLRLGDYDCTLYSDCNSVTVFDLVAVFDSVSSWMML